LWFRCKEILAAILNLLETLERKVEQQESELSELKAEQQRIRTAESFQRRILPDVGMERHRQSIGTGGAILRSCSHIRAALPSQTSGMHWIDPDGQGVGDDPIYVYCNMTTGVNYILSNNYSGITSKLNEEIFKVRRPFCTTANPGYPFRIALSPDAIPG
jgi:hypothetical protein